MKLIRRMNMKIKKKQYEKELADRYWDGIQAGMRFALRSPEYAEKYADNIGDLRKIVENAMPSIQRMCDEVIRIFTRKGE